MIVTFEDHTYTITPKELEYIPFLIVKLLYANKYVTNKEIIEHHRKITGKGIGPNRIRILIHYIRTHNKLCCLISTQNGYIVSYDETEIRTYLKSLQQRINSITHVYNSIEKQLTNYLSERAPRKSLSNS